MKHFNLKIIFLVLLIAILTAGAAASVYYPENVVRLTEDEVDDLLEILRQRGVLIDREVIPRSTMAMSPAVAESDFSKPKDIADILLPDGYTERGGECYTENVLIKFNPQILIKCNPPAFYEDFKNVHSGSVVRKIRDIFGKYLPEQGDILIDIYESGNNRMSVIVTRTFDDFPVFDNSLLFGVSNEGVSSVTGLWFSRIQKNGKKELPKSAAHALMKFSSDRRNYGKRIVSVTQGYCLKTDRQNSKSVNLEAVWRIITDNGEIYYINSLF